MNISVCKDIDHDYDVDRSWRVPVDENTELENIHLASPNQSKSLFYKQSISPRA